MNETNALQLGRYASLIARGVDRPLAQVPFHAAADAPLRRHVLVGDGVHPQLDKRIVAHELRAVSAAQRTYCEPHVHACDELNLLLSLTHLVYEIRLGDEVFRVEAPATIYVPAGLVHSANVVEGSGFFVALLETDAYAAFPPP